MIGAAALFGLTLGWIAAPPSATAQTSFAHLMQEINPLLSHSQGYLGVLVSDGASDLQSYPYQLIIPAIFLALIVYCLNYLGDGLRDALDPKER